MIYLAGASVEIDRCEAAMAEIRAAGHEIAYDWCAAMRAARGPDSELSREELATAAEDCLEAIRRHGSRVWLLAPSPGVASIGCWIEIGAALGYATYDYSDTSWLLWIGEPRGPFATLMRAVPDIASALRLVAFDAAGDDAPF